MYSVPTSGICMKAMRANTVVSRFSGNTSISAMIIQLITSAAHTLTTKKVLLFI